MVTVSPPSIALFVGTHVSASREVELVTITGLPFTMIVKLLVALRRCVLTASGLKFDTMVEKTLVVRSWADAGVHVIMPFVEMAALVIRPAAFVTVSR